MEDESVLPVLRRRSHPGCFACARENAYGLGLDFYQLDDGAVEASFPCQCVFAGYPGMLHGGIICTLLDSAMTNCLFAHSLAGVTVDLNVRFRSPVAVSRPAAVRAWLQSDGPPVHRLAAEVRQDGHIAATATARFVEKRMMFWFQQGQIA